MTAKVVQVSFSEQEYEFLSKQAEIEGLTIPLLIKNRVLPKGDFDKVFDKLKKLVKDLESGKVFTVRDLFGTDWREIEKGMRLSLGRTFYKNVLNGAIGGVEALKYKDSANTQLYKKI